MSSPSRSHVVAAFAIIYLVWGTTFLGIHYAIETLPPFFMGSVRYLIAGAALYGWAHFRKASRPSAHQWKTAFIAGAFFMLIGQGGVAWGQQSVPSGVAAVLVGTIPMWILLLEWIRPGGRRPGLVVSVGLLLGFVGVVVLVAPWESGTQVIDPLGAAAILLAAFAWAVGSLYAKSVEWPASHAQAAGMQLFAGGVLLLVAAVIGGELWGLSLVDVSITSALAVLYLVVFSSIIAFSAYSWLLGVCRPTRVATFAYVNPVVAVGLGWLFVGEPLTGRMLFAMAITIGAVALASTGTERADSPAAPAIEAPCCFDTSEDPDVVPVELEPEPQAAAVSTSVRPAGVHPAGV
ncbi:MAG: EamA family transporter [Actinobacteria bacterium]|nr:EamA family transporter [Actinomycetota bacterium]